MTKYTKEKLEAIVKDSLSFAEVLRKLGLRQCGGTQSHIKKQVVRFDIDYSHFLGQAINKGKVDFNKKSWNEFLVEGRRVEAYVLRRSLIESGREYKCELCQNKGDWNGTKLVLQVDHKNGDNMDNRKENIRFLCPNCHSQTANWSGKGIKTKSSV